MSESIEETAAKIARFDSEIKGLQQSFDGFKAESRDNFTRLFEKVERATMPKETPWGHIFAGIGVLVTILGGICGGGLTLLIALAAWANAYFGDMIAKADAKADAAITMRDTVAGLVIGRQSDEKEMGRILSRLDSMEKTADSRERKKRPPSK